MLFLNHPSNRPAIQKVFNISITNGDFLIGDQLLKLKYFSKKLNVQKRFLKNPKPNTKKVCHVQPH